MGHEIGQDDGLLDALRFVAAKCHRLCLRPTAAIDKEIAMIFKRVDKRQTVAKHIVDALHRSILSGQVKPGDKLPGQRELAPSWCKSAVGPPRRSILAAPA